MKKKSCENQIPELKRFFRWLHRSKDFAWRKPEDFHALDTRVKEITDAGDGDTIRPSTDAEQLLLRWQRQGDCEAWDRPAEIVVQAARRRSVAHRRRLMSRRDHRRPARRGRPGPGDPCLIPGRPSTAPSEKTPAISYRS
jgi:hypothetical protein